MNSSPEYQAWRKEAGLDARHVSGKRFFGTTLAIGGLTWMIFQTIGGQMLTGGLLGTLPYVVIACIYGADRLTYHGLHLEGNGFWGHTLGWISGVLTMACLYGSFDLWFMGGVEIPWQTVRNLLAIGLILVGLRFIFPRGR